ncbi:hypothetical protein NXY56_000199 [Leishmania guyanensis]
MQAHTSVARNGTEDSCGRAVDTDGSDSNTLGDVSAPYYPPSRPTPPTVIEDANRHEDSRHPKSRDEKVGSNTEAAESAVATVENSRREGSYSAMKSATLLPSVVRVQSWADTTSLIPSYRTIEKSGAAVSPGAAHDRVDAPPFLFTPERMPPSFRERALSPLVRGSAAVHVQAGALAEEAGQRVAHTDTGTINAAPSSQQSVPLWKHGLYDAQQLTPPSHSESLAGSWSPNRRVSHNEVCLEQRAPATASALRDAERHPISMNAAVPLSWRSHSPSRTEPALGPDIATSTAVDAAVMPTSEGVTDEERLTPSVSASLYVKDQLPLPGPSSSPLHDSGSLVNTPGTSVSALARFGKNPSCASPVSTAFLLATTLPWASSTATVTPVVPPHSPTALSMSSVPTLSPLATSPPSWSTSTLVLPSLAHPRPLQVPPAPLPQHQPQHPVFSSAKMASPVSATEEGEEKSGSVGEELLSWYGNPHTPVSDPENDSTDFFSAPGQLFAALCSPLLSKYSVGNGDLSAFGSPAAAGLTARPNSPSLLPEAPLLTAGTSLAHPLGQPPASLPPILSTAPAASSTSLSLLSPISAVSDSFSSGSGGNDSTGGTGGGGAHDFRSPFTFRTTPLASVVTPEVRHHQPHHPPMVLPHPCFFHRPAFLSLVTPPSPQQSPTQENSFSLPPNPPQQQQMPPDRSPACNSMTSIPSLSLSFYPIASPPTLSLSATATGHGPLPASSLLFMQGGSVAVATPMSPASTHGTTGGSPTTATAPSSAYRSLVIVPWSGKSSSPSWARRAHRSLLTLFSSTPGLPSPSWPLPGQVASALSSSSTGSVGVLHKEEDRGDALSPNTSSLQFVLGTPRSFLAKEAGLVEMAAWTLSSGAAGSNAVAARDDPQPQDQLQHHSHRRLLTALHLSMRGVAAQPPVRPQAWHVWKASVAAEVRSVDKEQSVNIASPADSPVALQPLRESYEREVPRGVGEVLGASDMGRKGDSDGGEANTLHEDKEICDADYGEKEVTAFEDKREAHRTLSRSCRSQNSIVARSPTVAAAAAVTTTAATVFPRRLLQLPSFAVLSHGKTSAAATAVAAAETEASPQTQPTSHVPLPSTSSTSFAARGEGTRGSGAAPSLVERLFVSSTSFVPPRSPSYRKTPVRAADSRSQNTCCATQLCATAPKTLFNSQTDATSHNGNNSRGGRRRGSPMRSSSRCRHTSSVTIIGVSESESLAMPVRDATSSTPDPTPAGAASWGAASASTRAAHGRETPTSSAAASPLAELLPSPPFGGIGGSVSYRLSSGCDGDIPTPDMAAAAAAAVLRLHRQRPNPTPPLSTALASSPERSAATQSLEGDGEAEGNASMLTAELSTSLPYDGNKTSRRLFHRTPSSLARAVAVALRRPSLAEDTFSGGVPLHNPSPSIPSLLISSMHPSPVTATAPATAASLGEFSAKLLQRVQEGETAEADGAAAEGGPEVLKQQRGEQEELRSGGWGVKQHNGKSPSLNATLLPFSPTAVLAAPKPPSKDKIALPTTTATASRRHCHRRRASPPNTPPATSASGTTAADADGSASEGDG